TIPKVVDLALRDSKQTYEGIYTVDDGRLKICLNINASGSKERPIEFSVQDKSNLRLLIFERVTDGASEPPAGYVGIGLDLGEQKPEVVINSLVDDSPAKKAGLQAGDVLLKVGDVDVVDGPTFVETIRGTAPGTELLFHVRRDGVEKKIAVKATHFPFSLL